jgi:hypothetical protein
MKKQDIENILKFIAEHRETLIMFLHMLVECKKKEKKA